MTVKTMRLDQLLVERGLVKDSDLAQKMIMAGKVRVANQVVTVIARKFQPDVEVEVDYGPKYVSRGGEKLEPALVAFGLSVLDGRVCADVGASTGGFTDCLLQHGAAKVYAIDVGYGILHWKIRSDARVVVMERTNARYVDRLPEQVSLVTIDASFISLQVLLPVVKHWLVEITGEIVALIKPQFEAGREEVSAGEGVIRDPQVHREVLQTILEFCVGEGFDLAGLVRSAIKGPKGNVEFLVHLRLESEVAGRHHRVEDLIDQVMR